MKKPHIRRVRMARSPYWACYVKGIWNGAVGFGKTPEEAYGAWRQKEGGQ